METSQEDTQYVALEDWVTIEWVKTHVSPLDPIRQWIDRLPIQNEQQAARLCRLIPAQCPFERDITFLGRTIFHIPPLCKLNPFYEELVALRFRALCYLADDCGVDVSQYC